MRKVLGLLSTLVATLALAAGCTVHQTEAPPLTGPSELALALHLTVIPDSISQDGASQASIVIVAVGPNGQPISALPIRLDMLVGGVTQDFGTLSARTIVTGSDGRASAVYTAPPPPPASVGGSTTTVTIRATATGNNAQASQSTTADIRLVPPGVILPPAATPSPKFTFSPTSPAASLPVLFDASTSCAGTSACTSTSGITNFTWSFGDGTPSASGVTVSHTFSTAGTFNVTLTVTNDRGVSASTTQAIPIGSSAVPDAQFTISPASPNVNQQILFDASASRPGAGHRLVSFNWNFGDGASSGGMTVTHSFSSPGTYSVVLTVTDEAGNATTKIQSLAIAGTTGAPVATFTFNPPSPITHGTTITADATGSTAASGSRIALYQWDFGDTIFGGTPVIYQSTSPTMDHTYGTDSGKGSFTIKLTVIDEQGRTGSSTRQITVF